MNLVCPSCHKDDAIQKVSAIVDSGQASGSFSGYSGGLVNIDGKWGGTSSFTSGDSYSASYLAQKFSPPLKPQEQIEKLGCNNYLMGLVIIFLGGSAFIIAGGLLSGLFFIGFPSYFNRSRTTFLIILSIISLVSGLLSFFFLIFVFRILKKDRDETIKEIEIHYLYEKQAWEYKMAKWNRLYYCHRDGIVYDPETQTQCQPDKVEDLLI